MYEKNLFASNAKFHYSYNVQCFLFLYSAMELGEMQP